MTSSDTDELEGLVQLLIGELRRSSSAAGEDALRQAIDGARRRYFVPLEKLEEAAERIRIMQAEIIRLPPFVDRSGRQPWFLRDPIRDEYWPAVRGVLEERLPEGAIDSVDGVSLRILNGCEPPKTSVINTRGLVIGYVQSGKTTNFTALIASAADAGYRLFIVLSGLHSNLRSQTQQRLDRDLVQPYEHGWYRLTDEDKDFGSDKNARTLLSSAKFQGRLLAVVKKNKRRLQNLNHWLEGLTEMELRAVPILVVDDEADHGSLNFSVVPEQRTAINAEIVKLLAVGRAAYVGYTATPFANILGPDATNSDDLYPKDFVVSLPMPDGYFGPERIFGREGVTPDDEPIDGCDIVRSIPQDEVLEMRMPARRAQRYVHAIGVGPSLDRAIRWFLLATAARRARGQIGARDHSTMLVHITHFVDVHMRLQAVIRNHVSELRGRHRPHLVDELQIQWDDEIQRTASDPCRASTPEPDFDEVAGELDDVFERLTVIVDNGVSEDRLDYGTGGPKYVIVIGGNTLARGLTLEGLVSSYFLRSSRNYDTLLQMGRWFGYRTGYEDLPRVWMSNDLEENFEFFGLLEEEMRRYIANLSLDPTISPANYAIRIRTHPAMQITSAMRMQNAKTVRASLADYRGQVTIYHRVGQSVIENLSATKAFLREATDHSEPAPPRSGVKLFKSVPVAAVQRFFSTYALHPRNQIVTKQSVLGYVGREVPYGALTEWNVVIIGRGSKGPMGTIDLGVNNGVNLLERSRLEDDPNVANIGVLLQAQDDYTLDLLGRPRTYQDPPLLMLYPISKDSRAVGGGRRTALEADEHLIGIALAFPPSPRHSEVEWAVPILSSVSDEDGEEELQDLDIQDREGDMSA